MSFGCSIKDALTMHLLWGSSSETGVALGPAPPRVVAGGRGRTDDPETKEDAMCIETEETPDPSCLRFLPACDVLPGRRMTFRSAAEAAVSPLAEALFDVPGISGVVLDNEVISITKTDGEWRHLAPVLVEIILDHCRSGEPTVFEETAGTEKEKQAMQLERDGEGFCIDAGFLGDLFDMPAGGVQDLLRNGRITSLCERGEGDDAGRFRLTFTGENRQVKLETDVAGKVLRRSVINFGQVRTG